MAELIVVTGGAYAGKTAVIGALAEGGHAVLPEAAYEVIAEINEVRGVDGQITWRQENQVAFQRMVTERQHAREETARNLDVPYVFCDRAALDGQAYCEQAGIGWPDDLHRLVHASAYAHVFVLETLGTFDGRRETGRLDTHRASIEIASRLAELYVSRATALTHVPPRTVGERVTIVLEMLGLA